MDIDINPLYIQNPQSSDNFVDSSLFNPVPAQSGDAYDQNPCIGSTEDLLDKGPYASRETQNVAHPRKISKKAKAIITMSATFLTGALGIRTVVNPFNARPEIQNGTYSLVENVLNYKFELKNKNGYECRLKLRFYEAEIQNVLLEEAKTYEGSFALVDHGSYKLEFYSSNNVDYQKTTSLYTFVY